MNKFLNPKCEKCGHYKQKYCLLINKTVQNITFCQDYTESPYICEICGRHLLSEAVNYTYGEQHNHHLICLTCYSMLSTCKTCKSANTCKFEQDLTIPEPAYITQQTRQGPAIIQQQIKNPKRINLTCKVNCPCFINEQCCKESHSCEKYQCSVENW